MILLTLLVLGAHCFFALTPDGTLHSTAAFSYVVIYLIYTDTFVLLPVEVTLSVRMFWMMEINLTHTAL